jgi:hypothetical protein
LFENAKEKRGGRRKRERGNEEIKRKRKRKN